MPDMSRGCVLCNNLMENSVHSFIHCSFAAKVWYAVFKWFKVVCILTPDLFTLFTYLNGFGFGSKVRKGILVIWDAAIWSLWRWHS
ncbi:hypothetical protein TSUD_361150 [Trifolium subterraneum]|uniref:Reverse transcriptase zinc-binding domain-containing protein n=1 Tax=Trifolium subterraneum TaxID=3900 RepID=A0A2Z6NLM7_TRISU|nr:hypothetical protein TSUD_361150 [Trifolium subterraneum]